MLLPNADVKYSIGILIFYSPRMGTSALIKVLPYYLPSNALSLHYSFLFLVLFKVFCCDHTYTTIRSPVAASVREVISAVADKLGSVEDLLLVNLSSAGGERCSSYMLIK